MKGMRTMATVTINGITIETDDGSAISVSADGSITINTGITSSGGADTSANNGASAARGNIGFEKPVITTGYGLFDRLSSLNDHPYLSEAKRGVTVERFKYGTTWDNKDYYGWVFDPSTLRPSSDGASLIATAERDGDYRTFNRDKILGDVEAFL